MAYYSRSRNTNRASALFLQDLPVELMIHLLNGEDYGRHISKELGASYSSLNSSRNFKNVYSVLMECGCITFIMKNGRTKLWSLTPYGKEVAEALKKIKETGMKASVVQNDDQPY